MATISITVLSDPRKTFLRAPIIEKLQKHFPVLVDCVNYEPTLVKAKFANSNSKYFTHDCGVLIIYDHEITDMIETEFVVNFLKEDKVSKSQWIDLFKFLRNLLDDNELDYDLEEKAKSFINFPKVFNPISNPNKKDDDCKMIEGFVRDHYDFRYEVIEDQNICIVEIFKPNVDKPYSLILRNFKEDGFNALFYSMYIDSTWGIVDKKDNTFMWELWKYLNMKGDFNLDEIVKDAASKCFPNEDGCPKLEPIVYRETLEVIKEGFMRKKKVIEDAHEYQIRKK